MDQGLPAAEGTHATGNTAVVGDHPAPRRKAAGRRPAACIDAAATAAAAAGVIRKVFPWLPAALNALPDPRRQEMCRYSGGHIWYTGLLMFLARCGSRNAFDMTRNSGEAPRNMGAFCGQAPDDPRFDGEPTVTCTDNLVHHLARVEPLGVTEIQTQMCAQLLEERKLDSSRLFDRWHVLVFDGTLHERCRRGFDADGKSGGKDGAKYRYVLVCGILSPAGTLIPLMQEHVDMHDPVTEKEDCELTAFFRLAARIKARFPRMRFCVVGDALYCAERVVALCTQYRWKFMLTLKEGRQRGLWDEVLSLLPLCGSNRLRCWTGQDGGEGLRDYRWVSDLRMGEQKVTVVLVGEMTPGQTEHALFVYATDIWITPARVVEAVSVTGRERHRIEDFFNEKKNLGVGLEHVFCATARVSKNLFALMQIASILWTIICRGYLRRVFDWAARATEIALARAVGEGMRARAFPQVLPAPGQIRFVT